MLDESRKRLAEATPDEMRLAELFAHAFMTAELVENLIPHDTAMATASEHHRAGSEEWQRAVHAALTGIRAAEAHGFRFSETARP